MGYDTGAELISITSSRSLGSRVCCQIAPFMIEQIVWLVQVRRTEPLPKAMQYCEAETPFGLSSDGCSGLCYLLTLLLFQNSVHNNSSIGILARFGLRLKFNEYFVATSPLTLVSVKISGEHGLIQERFFKFRGTEISNKTQ